MAETSLRRGHWCGYSGAGQPLRKICASRLPAAAALALAATCAWSEPGAHVVLAAEEPPIGILDASLECASIASVRQAPPAAWHPLSSSLARAGHRPDVLW